MRSDPSGSTLQPRPGTTPVSPHPRAKGILESLTAVAQWSASPQTDPHPCRGLIKQEQDPGVGQSPCQGDCLAIVGH